MRYDNSPILPFRPLEYAGLELKGFAS